jgi:hypothetical protein
MSDRVLMRVYPQGDVVAVLIDQPGTNDPYSCACYQTIGQHGSCDPQHVIQSTRPATPDEWRDLGTELARIGYDPRVIKRTPSDALQIRRGAIA